MSSSVNLWIILRVVFDSLVSKHLGVRQVYPCLCRSALSVGAASYCNESLTPFDCLLLIGNASVSFCCGFGAGFCGCVACGISSPA